MIEIINYQRENKNKIIGYADIILPAMQIPRSILRRIAHLKSGDREWFNMPNFSKQKDDGSYQYLKYWQFETEVYNGQLMESLHPLVKEFCLKNKIEEIVPLDFFQKDIEIEGLPF